MVFRVARDGRTIGRTTRSVRKAKKAYVKNSLKIPKTKKKILSTVRQFLRSDPVLIPGLVLPMLPLWKLKKLNQNRGF